MDFTLPLTFNVRITKTQVYVYNFSVSQLSTLINPCPTEHGFILFSKNTVDPDQLASDEAI